MSLGRSSWQGSLHDRDAVHLQRHFCIKNRQSSPRIGSNRSLDEQGPCRWHHPHFPLKSRPLGRCSASGKDDLDIAVFRFTLGIPGFDDGLIPRILGFAGLVILVINRVASQSIADESQVRAELIGCVLAGLCIAVPAISKTLEDIGPGKGRKSISAELAGSILTFKLADDLSDPLKKELAWSSFALLRNTNTAGVLICSGNRIFVARGAIKSSASENLKALEQVLQQAKIPQETGNSLYPDRASIKRSGLSELLPQGAQSLMVMPINSQGKGNFFLISWSESSGAFSQRDKQWTFQITQKLASSGILVTDGNESLQTQS